MAGILFMEKSGCDFESGIVTVTVTPSEFDTELSENILGRSLRSGYISDGAADDAEVLTFVIDMIETQTGDQIILRGHNLAAYGIKYWNGSAFAAFSTPIAVTGNTADANYHSFTEVNTSKLELKMNGTSPADAEKILRSIIFTQRIGQLAGFPRIRIQHARRRRELEMLSGDSHIIERPGGFRCTLAQDNWASEADLDILEDLFNRPEGFLVSLSGGDESQFAQLREGYRAKDVYLVRCVNDWRPEWSNGIYVNGMNVEVELAEVTT